MKKVFVLSSAIPELATNGKLSVHPTLDSRVNLIIYHKQFKWPRREITECFRCPRCNCFILPEDGFKKNGNERYHKNCTFLKLEQKLLGKEE